MSLINDALKRAKDAQQMAPPPAPGPQFRPVEPAQTTTRRIGLLVPFILVAIALIGLFFLWQARQKTARNQPSSEAKPAAVLNQTPEARTQPSPPVRAVAVATPNSKVNPVATSKPVGQGPVVTAASTPVTATNVPAPALKLQALFFSPGRSSAIISGKTVWAGDTLMGFRVAAITRNSATLVSASETNVLALDQ